ncbi:MAG: hypothetical protein V3R39_03070 [Nitrosopumilus sp.]
MGNDNNSKTVTEDPQKIKDLQNQLAQKSEQIKNLKEKNSDDIAPGIRKQRTFEGNFRNGYSDGTVEKEREKIRAKERLAKLTVRK